MSDTNDEILHVIGRGVASLRRDLADAEGRVFALDQSESIAANRAQRAENDLSRCREINRELRTELEQCRDTAARSEGILTSYDRITLALYHYIVELAGHRDTAKTKAERIALGHVVERLKEIRGIDDYERPEPA